MAFSRLIPLIACLPLTSACDYDEADARFRVEFDGLTCEDAGVDVAEVTIERQGGAFLSSATVQCIGDSLDFTLSDVEEGTYLVSLTAFDADGRLLYDNDDGDIVFLDDGFSLVDIDVPPSTGDLTIFWTFEGDDRCGAVDDVSVLLEDPFSSVFDDADYPCDFGGVTYDQIIAGLWRVSLRGRNGDNQILFRADGRDVRVVANTDSRVTIDLD